MKKRKNKINQHHSKSSICVILWIRWCVIFQYLLFDDGWDLRLLASLFDLLKFSFFYIICMIWVSKTVAIVLNSTRRLLSASTFIYFMYEQPSPIIWTQVELKVLYRTEYDRLQHRSTEKVVKMQNDVLEKYPEVVQWLLKGSFVKEARIFLLLSHSNSYNHVTHRRKYCQCSFIKKCFFS